MRQTEKDRHTEKESDKEQTDGHINICMYKQRYQHTETDTDKKTDKKQIYRQTDRQLARETYKCKIEFR